MYLKIRDHKLEIEIIDVRLFMRSHIFSRGQVHPRENDSHAPIVNARRIGLNAQSRYHSMKFKTPMMVL